MLSKETKELVQAFCELRSQGHNNAGTHDLWISAMSAAFDNGDLNNGIEIRKIMQRYGLKEVEISKYDDEFTGAMLVLGYRAKRGQETK